MKMSRSGLNKHVSAPLLHVLGVPMSDYSRANEFLQLLIQHQRQIYAFIQGMVPNHSDADDLFQETILLMWSRFDGFEQGTSFTSWGITMAKYTVFTARKRYARRNRQFSPEVQALLQRQSDQVFPYLDQRSSALKQCLGRLSERDSELIRLRYEEEQPIKQIAEQRGRSLQSVYKRLARIHTLLLNCVRQKLGREEFA
jgi:RNA polymerase sigma-70 factor (ECF subfamily)